MNTSQVRLLRRFSGKSYRGREDGRRRIHVTHAGPHTSNPRIQDRGAGGERARAAVSSTRFRSKRACNKNETVRITDLILDTVCPAMPPAHPQRLSTAGVAYTYDNIIGESDVRLSYVL